MGVGEEVQTPTVKANPYHDEKGRFTTADRASRGDTVRGVPRRTPDWGFDTAKALRDLDSRQREFARDPANRGIRVDARLEGEPVSPEFLDKMIGFSEGAAGHFVLTQGQRFQVPDSAPQIDLMTPKECFENAAKMSAMNFMDMDRYDYVEGFLMDQGLPFPIHHAWVTEKGSNEVIDPTLGWLPTAAYRGVKMDSSFVLKKLAENGHYGLFSDGAMYTDLVLGKDKDFEYR